MELLTKEQIFSTDDLVTERVYISEWKGDVLVKSLTANQKDLFQASFIEEKGANKKVNLRNITAKLVQRTAVDAEGKPLFFEKDIPSIGDKNAAAVNKLFAKAQELSGITSKDVDELSAPKEGEEADTGETTEAIEAEG